MATMRSQHWKTWCMLWLMKMPVTPCSRRPRTKPMHLVGLLDRQMVGRLVEDHHLRLEMHGARDGDALPLAAGELADQRVGRAQVQVDVGDRLDALARASASGRAMPKPPTDEFQRLAPDEQVAGDRHGRDHRIVLVDGLDAERSSRASGLRMSTGSPSIRISPWSGRCTPERILISVDLPAPLSPTRPSASPRSTVEADALQRMHARIPFMQVRDTR